MRASSKAHLALICLPLLAGTSTGCLALLSAAQKPVDEARRLARFDADCPSVKVVKSLGERRFRLRGCGQELVYACDKTTRSRQMIEPKTKVGAVFALADALLIGPSITDVGCFLVAKRPAPRQPPPSPTTRWPPASKTRRRPPKAPRAVAKAKTKARTDEPGHERRLVSLPAQRAAGVRAQRASPAEIRLAQEALLPSRKEIQRCVAERHHLAPAMVSVKLGYDKEGKARSVEVTAAGLQPRLRACLVSALRRSTLKPRGRPVTVRATLQVR